MQCYCLNIWIFFSLRANSPRLVSAQNLENSYQPPKYAWGDAQLQRAGYKTLSLVFFFIGTDFPNTLQLHLYSHLPG